VLTAASVFPKSGYFMSETGFVGPGGTNSSYVAEAGPVTFDRTGHHSYCIILDNIVRMDPTNVASGLPGTNPVACLAAPFTPLE
jgi:hypothetical protein